MKISTATLIASVAGAATVAIAPTVHAEPPTLEALCDAQTWLRPVPDVVGVMFEPVDIDTCELQVHSIGSAS